MTTATKCRANDPSTCNDPDCPEKRALRAEMNNFIAEAAAPRLAVPYSKSKESRDIEKGYTKRKAQEMLDSELGEHLKKDRIEFSKDGERFILVVEEPFTYREQEFEKNDRVEFDQSGELVRWAGYVD